MKFSIIILLGIFFSSNGFGQNKMIINERFNGNIHYGEYAEQLDSLRELPSTIQLNVKGHLEQILGEISDSVSFSHGQIIDLDSKFKADSIIYNSKGIVPKYDLNFIIKDISVGIQNYYLQMRLDMFGQLLSVNWPKESHSDIRSLPNPKQVEEFALKQAKIKGFETNNYEVVFNYNRALEEFSWMFKFPLAIENSQIEFNVLEVSWNDLKIINEYRSLKKSSH